MSSYQKLLEINGIVSLKITLLSKLYDEYIENVKYNAIVFFIESINVVGSRGYFFFEK